MKGGRAEYGVVGRIAQRQQTVTSITYTHTHKFGTKPQPADSQATWIQTTWIHPSTSDI